MTKPSLETTSKPAAAIVLVLRKLTAHAAGIATGYMQTYGGTNMFKAILSAPGNHGLRCDLTSDGAGHGGGICVDDENRVYDIIFQ